MLRLAASFILTVVFFLGAALCGGGILEHACDCAPASESQCEHESECPDDPCSATAPAVERNQIATLLALLPPRRRDFVGESTFSQSDRFTVGRPAHAGARRMLPYAPSDRPLLN